MGGTEMSRQSDDRARSRVATFLAQSGSCAAHLALAATFMPRARASQWAASTPGAVVAREPFGNLEKVSDGVWALISTPLERRLDDRVERRNHRRPQRRAGDRRLQQAAGRRVARRERRASSRARWPTHVALTHYHADHANGVAGYLTDADHPMVRSTARTRDLVVERNQPADASRIAAVKDAVLFSATDATTLDLGGRTVRVIPRSGHTDSDVSLELDDPSIVFCGDLFWNAMFPNFVDAVPTKLSASVRALRRTRDTTYMPGPRRDRQERPSTIATSRCSTKWNAARERSLRRGNARGRRGRGVYAAGVARRVDAVQQGVLPARVRGVVQGIESRVERRVSNGLSAGS